MQLAGARIVFIIVFVSLCLLCFSLLAAASAAAMEPMNEAEMEEVQAQSGIAFAAGNVRIYRQKEHFGYEDTSGNGGSIELAGITYTDGNGGPMRFHSPQPITFSIFDSHGGRPVAGISAPEWEQDVAMDVADLYFCGENLGSLHVHGLEPTAFAVYAAPLDSGTGIGFQFETRADLEDLRWAYNDNGDALSFQGMQLAWYFGDDGDDPADPSTWQPEGRFIAGDLDMDGETGEFRPAEFRVAGDDEGRALVRLDVNHLAGSLRMADVEMGDHNLGPVIVGGMDVHKLRVDFVPFDP